MDGSIHQSHRRCDDAVLFTHSHRRGYGSFSIVLSNVKRRIESANEPRAKSAKNGDGGRRVAGLKATRF